MRMRGKKARFNRKDVWNLDKTLAPIIHAGLVKFKEETLRCSFKSYPGDFEGEDDGFEQWMAVVDQMIYAFDDNYPTLKEFGVKFSKERDGLFAKINVNNEEAYAEYRKALNDNYRKKQKGYELFGKYFCNLWS